jgi:hypothetical protein
MTSETIDIELGPKQTKVRALFAFRSTKEGAPARQLVGFPDQGAALVESEKRDPKGGAEWHMLCSKLRAVQERV